MSAPENKAIFLSYASQDAEAVKRICEALRAAGVEVWFDQNELVGGDAWDAKIRGQISSCALFVPVISAATQARREGYFRLEWKLASQRTHMIADGTPFLLPVVIDETRDANALVPAEFKSVQWTRLVDGAGTEKFCARVQRMLSDDHNSPLAENPTTGGGQQDDSNPATRSESAASARRVASGRGKRQHWSVLGTLVALTSVAAGLWSDRSNPTPTPAAPQNIPADRSPVEELRARTWELLNRPEMARSELEAAEALCRKAAELDPTNADVWAAWSSVNTWFVWHGFDRLPERLEAARSYASKAMRLSPKSYEARLAQALFWIRGDAPRFRLPEGRALLRELLHERPEEPRALYSLGFALLDTSESFEEGIATLGRLARNPNFTAVALDEAGWAHYFYGQTARAQEAADLSVAARPYWNNLGLQIKLALYFHGDTDRARRLLAQMPASVMQEDWGISFAWETFMWSRKPQQALEAVESVQRDWIRNFFSDAPRAYLQAVARQAAGQQVAAQRDYQRALNQLNQALANDPNNAPWILLKAVTLRELGQEAAAQEAYRLVSELKDSLPLNYLAWIQIQFEPTAAAVAAARKLAESPFKVDSGSTIRIEFTASALRLNPWFDRLRSEPAFQKLVTDVAAREAKAAAATPVQTQP